MNSPRRSHQRRYCGSSQATSRCVYAPCDVDEVDGPVADHVIRDVDVAAPCEPDVRHGGRFPPHATARQLAAPEGVRSRQRLPDGVVSPPPRARAGRATRCSRRGRSGSPRPARSGHARGRAARRARSPGAARRPPSGTIRFTWPCSSSRSMKTIPFAVDGRWRATVIPANGDLPAVSLLVELRARERPRREGAGAAARADASRSTCPCGGSRRASAPSASGRAGRASRRSARARAEAASSRRPCPGTDCARKTRPSSQRRSRRGRPEAVAGAALDERLEAVA